MKTLIKTRILDRIDLSILDVLQRNGRISNVNLAKQVNLSPSPCLERVKKLEDAGYIEGYSAKLNATKLQQNLVAHVEVTLKESTEAVFDTFKQDIMRIKQVVSCDLVAGGYDYLLKIRVSDMTEYREVLGKIVDIPGVGTNRTYMVIEHVKQDSGLVIDTTYE
jgi:Lrp/AsnC family leucine-responsive transcriptional regulator